MNSIAKWIWGGIKAVCSHLVRVASWLWDLVTSWVSWVVASISYVLSQVAEWLQDSIDSALQDITGAFTGLFSENVTSAPDVPDLAAYYLGNVLSMDEAFALLVTLVGLWLLARSARLLMVPIRAILELL